MRLYSGPSGLQKEGSLVSTTRFVNLKRAPRYFTISKVYDNCYTHSLIILRIITKWKHVESIKDGTYIKTLHNVRNGKAAAVSETVLSREINTTASGDHAFQDEAGSRVLTE